MCWGAASTPWAPQTASGAALAFPAPQTLGLSCSFLWLPPGLFPLTSIRCQSGPGPVQPHTRAPLGPLPLLQGTHCTSQGQGHRGGLALESQMGLGWKGPRNHPVPAPLTQGAQGPRRLCSRPSHTHACTRTPSPYLGTRGFDVPPMWTHRERNSPIPTPRQGLCPGSAPAFLQCFPEQPQQDKDARWFPCVPRSTGSRQRTCIPRGEINQCYFFITANPTITKGSCHLQ